MTKIFYHKESKNPNEQKLNDKVCTFSIFLVLSADS